MRVKTLAVLAVILGILGGIGLLILRAKAPEEGGGPLGATLIAQLPVNEVAAVTLQGPGEQASLVRRSDRWVVRERSDYPADFSKIAGLVREIKATKIGRTFEASAETMRRLCLMEPDDSGAMPEQQGTRLRLADDKGRLLADILLGTIRIPDGEQAVPDSRYVRLGDSQMIYLIDAPLSAYEPYPSTWLDRTLVKVPAERVREITCLAEKPAHGDYALVRPREGADLEPSGPATAGKSLKKSMADKVAGALASLRLEDVAPVNIVSKSAPGERPVLAYRLFDGTRYRVYPGSGCEGTASCAIRIEVDFPEDGRVSDAAGAGDEKAPGGGKDMETRVREAKKLNERLSPWLFSVPNWQHAAFVTDLNALLVK